MWKPRPYSQRLSSKRNTKAPKWCNYHRSSTHSGETCRRKTKQKDDAKQTAERQQKHEEEETSVFKVSQQYLPDNIKANGVMVDCGATSHIKNEINKFTTFDETFNPEKHHMERADGSKPNKVALKREDAEVLLQDIKERYVVVTLKKALFISTYPHCSSFHYPREHISYSVAKWHG